MNEHNVNVSKLTTALLFALMIAITSMPLTSHAASSVQVWWPTNGVHMSGSQPLKAMVPGMDISQYDMYWQVDGGALNPMNNTYSSSPHKEADISVSGWNWKGSGSYTITFIAKQHGTTIGQQSETIYVDGTTSTQPSTSVTVVAAAPIQQVAQTSANTLQAWWPTNGVHMSGTQPFKAAVPGMDISQYDMSWQVDGGTLNSMSNVYSGSPHKEANVNVSGWNWRGSGPYTVTFVARKNGSVIAQQSQQIYVDGQTTSQATSQSTQTVLSASVQSSSPNLSSFYVDPNSSAANQAKTWASSNQSGAQAMQTLASQPTAVWFGNWNSNIQSDARSLASKAQSQGKTATIVAYDIPGRDCGGYSSGGSSQSDYLNWIRGMAAGIGSASAAVILEPDALAGITCLSSGDQNTRYSLLAQAVQILKQNSNTRVYLDAGHSGWVDPGTMAGRLVAANVAQADGFALNVSNFDTTSSESSYGAQISSALQGKIGQNKHFIIDTSRNGNGSNGEWCNPSGRAIGNKPTTSTGNALIDAYLWVKTPGESDGNCNGGPSAGTWWASYAQSLVQNAH